jgi:hypothetical protein
VTRRRLIRLVLGAVGLAVGVVAVLALREATLSTHEEVDARETELVVSGERRGGEKSQTLSEMVEAQVSTCRLEVDSDLVGPLERLDDGRYRAVLAPALDETNRKQIRGCLQDWIVDHLQIDVEELTNVR